MRNCGMCQILAEIRGIPLSTCDLCRTNRPGASFAGAKASLNATPPLAEFEGPAFLDSFSLGFRASDHLNACVTHRSVIRSCS